MLQMGGDSFVHRSGYLAIEKAFSGFIGKKNQPQE